MENEINNQSTTSQLKGVKSVAFTILGIVLITDIFFITGSFDLITFSLLGFYVVLILIYKLSSTSTFFLCLALLLLAYVQFVFLGPIAITEKTSVWFVLFFIIGIVQRFKE